jgi:predicted DNA-binding protein
MNQPPAEPQATKMVALRMPLELAERARRLAEQDDRTMTSLILHLVRKHVQQKETGGER